jgi:phospholipid-translocating ATPase
LARWVERDPDAPEKEGRERTEPITIDSMLLRGCTLRNTGWVIGIVVFTGEETKIMMNAGITPSKRSRISRELNWHVCSTLECLWLLIRYRLLSIS